MRVLIVEDDETIASFVVKGLREAGLYADIAEGTLGLSHWLRPKKDTARAFAPAEPSHFNQRRTLMSRKRGQWATALVGCLIGLAVVSTVRAEDQPVV